MIGPERDAGPKFHELYEDVSYLSLLRLEYLNFVLTPSILLTSVFAKFQRCTKFLDSLRTPDSCQLIHRNPGTSDLTVCLCLANIRFSQSARLVLSIPVISPSGEYMSRPFGYS